MFSIRKVRTASGSIAIQVVQYQGHKSIIMKHIGSTKDAVKVSVLIQKAKEWISNQTKQVSLFVEPQQKILFVDRGECIGITHQFARQFLLCCINELGLMDMIHYCLI
jgi:hypothetical protein